MEKAIKLVLAILFFICLLDMPYGFYQLVRFLAMLGFGYLAYDSNLAGEKKLATIYVVLLVLFQPLIKLPLGRTLWNVVDVLVGVGLIVLMWTEYKRQL